MTHLDRRSDGRVVTRRHAIKQLGMVAAGAMAFPRLARAAADSTGTGLVDQRDLLPRVTFHNIAEIEPLADQGWRLSRVPRELLPHLNENARKRAYATAGCELRFNLNRGEARAVLRHVENRAEAARHLPVIAEIYRGEYLVAWFQVNSEWTELVIPALPDRVAAVTASPERPSRFPPQLVRVALPYLPDVQLLKIEGDVTPPRADQLPGRRYLAYGSSITNGAFASRPGELFPARIARSLGVDHFNLGFGGGAQLEPEMADWIGGRSDWDFATLELGINLLSRCSAAEFRIRVNEFLRRVVGSRPDRWIFCIDMFTTAADFAQSPQPAIFRAIVRDAVATLGAPRVVHCDGRELLTSPSGLTLDLVHPSAEGFGEIAERLVSLMRPRLTSDGV